MNSTTMSDNDGDQTGFLLQRLQELKAWQQEQEERLLLEQEDQMKVLYLEAQEIVVENSVRKAFGEEDDEDNTIDQDISSLASFEDAPANESSATSNALASVPLPEQSLPCWAKAVTNSGQENTSLANVERTNGNPCGPSHDEVPITAKEKSFQELLNEQLALNGQAVQTTTENQGSLLPTTSGSSRPTSSAKPFLRRGSGLARYGGVSGSPNGVVRKINSCGKLQTRNFASSATNVSKPQAAKSKAKLKTSTSCSKITSLSSKDASSVQRAKKVTRPMTNKDENKSSKPNKLEEAAVTKVIPAPGPYDSVELSFMEKLANAGQSHKKEMENLAAFEMLEEAACDSSFCSSSSTVKKLIRSSLPSPIPNKKTEPGLTSTPKARTRIGMKEGFQRKELCYEEDEAKDSDLMKDIHAFLTSKGANVIESGPDPDEAKSDDDDTLRDLVSEDMNENGWSGSEEWSDVEEDVVKRRRSSDKVKTKNVRFKEDDEAMEFSPPKIPKNSPSYLIWSIFTKEREERHKRQMQKLKQQSKSSPDASPAVEKDHLNGFESTLLNAKLTELEKEISHFKKENVNVTNARRKLNLDRRQLAKEIHEFEENREKERKKLEEEKKRIRREKLLFEKGQKDKKSTFDTKAQEEIDELQAKVVKLTEDLERKECKWSEALSKLQDQAKFLERENQQLHEENHKLKLKGVSCKVSTRLFDSSAKKVNLQDGADTSGKTKGKPGFSKHEKEEIANENQVVKGSGDVDATAAAVTLRGMDFSPADSLESDVTLVSAGAITESTQKTTRQELEIAKTRSASKVQSVKKIESKGTTEKLYDDGHVEVCYRNGNRKETSADGKTTKILYYNGDVKEDLPSGLVKYFYSQTKTWHLTYPDGKEVLQFSNGQEEIRYPNGALQILFADGSVKKISTDGSENIQFPDGTQVLVMSNGDRTLLMANGQKEFHTSEFKKREYPDGTVKILYEDGRQETRYSSGRVRIKDKAGILVHDSSLTSGTSSLE